MTNLLFENTLSELTALINMLHEEKEKYQYDVSYKNNELSSNNVELKHIEEEKDNKKDYFSPLSSKKTNLKNNLKIKEVEIKEEISDLYNRIENISERILSVEKLKSDLEEYFCSVKIENENTKNEDSVANELDSIITIKKSDIDYIKKLIHDSHRIIDSKLKLCENVIEHDSMRVKIEIENLKNEITKLKTGEQILGELTTNKGNYFLLCEQILKIVEEYKKNDKLIIFEYTGSIEIIDIEIKKIIYDLIIKECRNAFTYMNADKIMITAKEKEKVIQIIIADDGNSYSEVNIETDKINDKPIEFCEVFDKLKKLCSKFQFESEKHIGTTIYLEIEK